jgi:hypothetical protein
LSLDPARELLRLLHAMLQLLVDVLGSRRKVWYIAGTGQISSILGRYVSVQVSLRVEQCSHSGSVVVHELNLTSCLFDGSESLR